MDKPKSRTAVEIMQRADPSCKIWFVCKGQLICTRYILMGYSTVFLMIMGSNVSQNI
jgi:hypothetical protein